MTHAPAEAAFMAVFADPARAAEQALLLKPTGTNMFAFMAHAGDNPSARHDRCEGLRFLALECLTLAPGLFTPPPGDEQTQQDWYNNMYTLAPWLRARHQADPRGRTLLEVVADRVEPITLDNWPDRFPGRSADPDTWDKYGCFPIPHLKPATYKYVGPGKRKGAAGAGAPAGGAAAAGSEREKSWRYYAPHTLKVYLPCVGREFEFVPHQLGALLNSGPPGKDARGRLFEASHLCNAYEGSARDINPQNLVNDVSVFLFGSLCGIVVVSRCLVGLPRALPPLAVLAQSAACNQDRIGDVVFFRSLVGLRVLDAQPPAPEVWRAAALQAIQPPEPFAAGGAAASAAGCVPAITACIAAPPADSAVAAVISRAGTEAAVRSSACSWCMCRGACVAC